MNKDLYGERIELPEQIIVYLKQCYDSIPNVNANVEGYRRNKELRDSGYITYQQLKRMKNFFDTHPNNNDKPFILNGGDYVKNWVNQTLASMRNGIKTSKNVKSVVLPNQYISPHEKNQNLNNKNHQTTLDNYNLEIRESLNRINQLIKKII